jgi:acetyl esterase/lipase
LVGLFGRGGDEEGTAGGQYRAPLCSLQSLRSAQSRREGFSVWHVGTSNRRDWGRIPDNAEVIGQAASPLAAAAAAAPPEPLTLLLRAEITCLRSDKTELTELLVDARAENAVLRRDKRKLKAELEEARDEISRLRRRDMERNAQ